MTTPTETLTPVAYISDLSHGEAIVLKKGDNVVRGTVRIELGARRVDLGSGSAGPTVGNFTDAGYAIHRVGPSLPTNPGLYESEKYPLARGYAAYLLATHGAWFEVNRTGRLHDVDALAKQGDLGVLTPLVPKPATPTVIVDKDGDKWTLASDGTWNMNDNEEDGGETLDYVRQKYGPLKTLEGAPA